jgi:hypothetical protein
MSPRIVRLPGRLVMRLASYCFDEPALTTIVTPAVADLQREVLAAGRPAVGVRLRGYAALAKVLALAALVPGAGAGAPLTRTLLGLNGASSLALLAPVFYIAVSGTFGSFVAGTAVAGVALAVGLRAWNDRHPVAVAAPRRTDGRDPAINIASIAIGANAGGALFVLASVLTIVLGVPELRVFILAAIGVGVIQASALAWWRRAYPGSPPTRIAVR